MPVCPCEATTLAEGTFPRHWRAAGRPVASIEGSAPPTPQKPARTTIITNYIRDMGSETYRVHVKTIRKSIPLPTIFIILFIVTIVTIVVFFFKGPLAAIKKLNDFISHNVDKIFTNNYMYFMHLLHIHHAQKRPFQEIQNISRFLDVSLCMPCKS